MRSPPALFLDCSCLLGNDPTCFVPHTRSRPDTHTPSHSPTHSLTPPPSLSLPLHPGEDWRRAWAWTLVALALSAGGTGMMVRLSYVQAALMTALAARDPPALTAAILRFAGIAALAAPLYAASDFVTTRLAIEWRAWLAGHLLALYYADRGFYRLHGDGVPGGGGGAAVARPAAAGPARVLELPVLRPRNAAPTTTTPTTPPTPSTPAPPQNNNVGADPGLVDNPDQRIADDAADFTTRSVNLAFGFVGKASMACAFAGVLARTSPPWSASRSRTPWPAPP